jgi:hypothetical protein
MKRRNTAARWARQVDVNQGQIVGVLTFCGATVQETYRVGAGMPDLLVGWLGHNLLVEVKPPGQKLNEKEQAWFDRWNGQATIAFSQIQAVDLLLSVTPDNPKLLSIRAEVERDPIWWSINVRGKNR